MDSVMLITCASGCKEGIRADWSQLQRCTLALKTLLHYLLLLLLYVSKVQVTYLSCPYAGSIKDHP